MRDKQPFTNVIGVAFLGTCITLVVLAAAIYIGRLISGLCEWLNDIPKYPEDVTEWMEDEDRTCSDIVVTASAIIFSAFVGVLVLIVTKWMIVALLCVLGSAIFLGVAVNRIHQAVLRVAKFRSRRRHAILLVFAIVYALLWGVAVGSAICQLSTPLAPSLTLSTKCYELPQSKSSVVHMVFTVDVISEEGQFLVRGLRDAIKEATPPLYNGHIAIYKMTDEKKKECATTPEGEGNAIQKQTVYCFKKQ